MSLIVYSFMYYRTFVSIVEYRQCWRYFSMNWNFQRSVIRKLYVQVMSNYCLVILYMQTDHVRWCWTCAFWILYRNAINLSLPTDWDSEVNRNVFQLFDNNNRIVSVEKRIHTLMNVLTRQTNACAYIELFFLLSYTKMIIDEKLAKTQHIVDLIRLFNRIWHI
jgi:hypothetical protein